MTKIKFCGLSRTCDIEAVNNLLPDYIGFVFAPKSRRCVSADKASKLKRLLIPGIKAVGVFVNEEPGRIASLLNKGTIDIVQLHGDEGEDYIGHLRKLTDKPIIKAFRIKTQPVLKERNKAQQIMYCLIQVQVRGQYSSGS